MNLLNNFSKEESARRVHNNGCCQSCHSASHQFTNHNSRQFRDNACPSGLSRRVPHEMETEIEELFKKDKDVCIVCGYVSANEFFSFPSDVDTRQQWAAFCDLAFDTIKAHFRLCDRHFKTDDYRVSIQHKLLIPTSVPTLQPKVKRCCASSINNSLQSSLNTINISNQTFNQNTSKNSTYSSVFQSNITTDASNRRFRRIFGDITNKYDDDVPPKAKKLALKRKLKVKQSQQQTKCFRSEIFRLRTRCSRLEDTAAELRKRIERLDERCFVVPAESDTNIVETTRDRRPTIYSSEKPEASSCITEALTEKHYEKVAFVETTINGVEVAHQHQRLTTLLPKKSSDDPCNTNIRPPKQHSEKVTTSSTDIARNTEEVTCDANFTMFSNAECNDSLSNAEAAWPEDRPKKAALVDAESVVKVPKDTQNIGSTLHFPGMSNDNLHNAEERLEQHSEEIALVEPVEKVADEDGYSTDSSMPPLEISSNELHTSEGPLEKFFKEGGSRYSAQASLVEFIEKVTEDCRSAGSLILPLKISSDSLHDSEEQLEQFADGVALVETAENIIEDVGNINLSICLREKSNDSRDTDTAPEQYSEGEMYVEDVGEDDQFPNVTATLQKLNDNSPCNAKAQSQQRSEEDPASDPTKTTDDMFLNILDDDDDEVVTGITASPQINCQLHRNDTAASSNNEQFDKAYFGQTLRMEQVQVTTQQQNCNAEINVCQRNGQASPRAGCSKRQKNGDKGRITRSAKKKKEFPSVDTSIQTSDGAPKKVRKALTRDSPPYCCNICDETFSDKRVWKRHQQEHSKQFHCRKCGKLFSFKSYLIRHQATHAEKRPYKCGFCDSRFKHNRSKLHHERYMHKEVTCFECAVCGKMFNHRNSIIKHLRAHSGQKPFRCQTCGKRFFRKSDLVSHQKIHSKEKKFKCRICKQLFKYQRSKAAHERSHVEGPRFECAVCGKKYRRKPNLAHHISHNCS